MSYSFIDLCLLLINFVRHTAISSTSSTIEYISYLFFILVELLFEIKEFFNDLSLYTFKELATMEYEDIISSRLKAMQETFERDIEELKAHSVGNKTRTALLRSMGDDVEFVAKAIVDESSLKTQTEYINHWISKLILCQKNNLLPCELP
jgi:hypothetical protein